MFSYVVVEQHSPMYKEILALRYRVYVEQYKFENKDDHQYGVETDVYDSKSIHIAVVNDESKCVVGTVRFILNSELGFPAKSFFEFYDGLVFESDEKCAEISRISIDRLLLKKLKVPKQESEHILKCLIKKLAEECLKNNISHVYAVMEEPLFLKLRMNNIVFTKVGYDKQYHGVRAPYYGKIVEILKGSSLL